MSSSGPDGLPLLLRADASPVIGTGHAMRALALAQAWRETAGPAMLAAAACPPALAERFAAAGMPAAALPPAGGPIADAAATAALAERLGARHAGVDAYGFGGAYHRHLRQAGLRVLALDDFGLVPEPAPDLLLDQNTGAERFPRDLPPATRLLAGPRYALLRREFRDRPPVPRQTPEVARRILVTMGGADPGNASASALQALAATGLAFEEIVVLVGAANPHQAALQDTARALALPARLLAGTDDMPALLEAVDFAVTAGGTTCLELMNRGLPHAAVVLADNQERVVAELAALGTAVSLGWAAQLDPAAAAPALKKALADWAWRESASGRQQALVDGQGASRVAALLAEHPLFLRRATARDCRLLWEWVNDPETRRQSFSSDPIPWETHQAWFNIRLSDPQRPIFIACNPLSDIPVGVVRFEPTETGSFEISLAVAPEHRGRGLGRRLIQAGAARLFATSACRRIVAFTKKDNIASARSFAAAGFTAAGLATTRGHPAEAWETSRAA